MYSEAVAIVGMCVRQGKAGASFSLGGISNQRCIVFQTDMSIRCLSEVDCGIPHTSRHRPDFFLKVFEQLWKRNCI